MPKGQLCWKKPATGTVSEGRSVEYDLDILIWFSTHSMLDSQCTAKRIDGPLYQQIEPQCFCWMITYVPARGRRKGWFQIAFFLMSKLHCISPIMFNLLHFFCGEFVAMNLVDTATSACSLHLGLWGFLQCCECVILWGDDSTTRINKILVGTFSRCTISMCKGFANVSVLTTSNCSCVLIGAAAGCRIQTVLPAIVRCCTTLPTTSIDRLRWSWLDYWGLE